MIIVRGCLILTAVNLIILIRMAYITDRLVLSCATSSVTFDIGLHEMCVRGGRTKRMDSLPNFVTHGAPLRALRVGENSSINDASVDLNEVCLHMRGSQCG